MGRINIEKSAKITSAIIVTMIFVLIIGSLAKIILSDKDYEDITSVKNIEIGGYYEMLVSDYRECVFEASVTDFKSLKKLYNRIYLVPFGNEENTFIGIRVQEESSVIVNITNSLGNDENSNDNRIKRGKIKKYDRIMKYVMEENLKSTELASNNIKILPYYLDNTAIEWRIGAFEITMVICICVVVFCSVYISKRNQNMALLGSKERIWYKKGIGETKAWVDNWENYFVKTGITFDDLTDKIIGKRNDVDGQKLGDKEKSLIEIFKKHYYRKMIMSVMIAFFVIFLSFVLFISPDPRCWYYVFYGMGKVALVLDLIVLTYAVYRIAVYVINPIKYEIKRIVKEFGRDEDYFLSIVSNGRLFSSNKDYIYVSNRYCIIKHKRKIEIIETYYIISIGIRILELKLKNRSKYTSLISVHMNDKEYDIRMNLKTANEFMEYMGIINK